MILIALIVYNCNCCIVAIIKRHKVAVQRYICIEYCRVLHRLTTGTLSTDLIRQARVRSSWQFHSFHRENVPLSSNSTAMLTSPHMSGDTCGKSSHLQRIWSCLHWSSAISQLSVRHQILIFVYAVGKLIHCFCVCTVYVFPPGIPMVYPFILGYAGHVWDSRKFQQRPCWKVHACMQKLSVEDSFAMSIWVFPKIGVPPNHPYLIGCSIIFTIHFGVPLFLETSNSAVSQVHWLDHDGVAWRELDHWTRWVEPLNRRGLVMVPTMHFAPSKRNCLWMIASQEFWLRSIKTDSADLCRSKNLLQWVVTLVLLVVV